MKPNRDFLYSEMLGELNRCKAMNLSETEITEACFRIACEYWEKLKSIFSARKMYADEEEIEFFKVIKPKFTCHTEYYLILNQGLLFVPIETTDKINYWCDELRRYQRFFDRNTDFINYYDEKRNDHDADYFLQRNNRTAIVPQENIYNDRDCRSSHDNLVRSYLANSMYQEFVQQRLKELCNNDVPESRNR